MIQSWMSGHTQQHLAYNNMAHITVAAIGYIIILYETGLVTQKPLYSYIHSVHHRQTRQN